MMTERPIENTETTGLKFFMHEHFNAVKLMIFSSKYNLTKKILVTQGHLTLK